MGAIISYTIINTALYAAFYFTSTLCNACLGSTAPGTTGRKRSVLLLTIAILIALYFQYSVGPSIVNKNSSNDTTSWRYFTWIPGVGTLVYNSWYNSCQQYENHTTNTNNNMYMIEQCAGNAGVLRPMAIATIFFLISAIASKIRPSLNKEVWPAKFSVFLFAVAISVIMDNSPFYTGFYLWLARFGATIFVLLQQIILIDVAYNWNEDWIDRADQADRLVYGSGTSWLHMIVATCIASYIVTLTGIVLLYKHFGQCTDNIWIITLTLFGIIGLTGVQLSGHDGSLLTSSIISLYVTYLAYNMVSKNPNGECNPQLGSNDVTGIVIGLSLTAISLAWTGWSWTAEDRLNVSGVQSTRSVSNATATNNTNRSSAAAADGSSVNLDVPFLDPTDAPTSGLVMDVVSDYETSNDMNLRGYGGDVWKLNIVMALICCFVAMTLTGWGTIATNIDTTGENDASAFHHAANPTVGRFNMAMIGISQWSAILLYIWTLIAPQLFPDRDFS